MGLLPSENAFCGSAFCNSAFQVYTGGVGTGKGKRKKTELKARIMKDDEEVMTFITGFIGSR